MNPDGSNVQQVTHNTVPDLDPAWSPDGTEIAFAHRVGTDTPPDARIAKMNADGTNVAELVLGRQGSNFVDRRWPNWSPTGTSSPSTMWKGSTTLTTSSRSIP